MAQQAGVRVRFAKVAQCRLRSFLFKVGLVIPLGSSRDPVSRLLDNISTRFRNELVPLIVLKMSLLFFPHSPTMIL